MFRSSALHRLGEDARVGAAVKARKDHAVAFGVKEGDRERLVSACVGKGVEAHHADLLDAALRELLELVMQPVQRLHPLSDRVQAPKLPVKELVQAYALALT